MSRKSEKVITQAALSQAAISELGRLSLFLDTELGATDVSMEDVEEDFSGMEPDPHQPLPTKISRLFLRQTTKQRKPEIISGTAGCACLDDDERDNEMPVYVYIPDEPLLNECTDEVKLLILGIRHLGHQQRYEEALDLAREATRLAPNYWRAWISLGTLLVLFSMIDDGNKIFEDVSRDFADNPKAVAAALHCHAWVKEIRYGLNPSTDALREMAQLYETALELDDSRANTRACLLINRLMADKTGKETKLLEASVLCEGFFDALRLEINERGTRMLEVLQALPSWLRHLLYPIRLIQAGG